MRLDFFLSAVQLFPTPPASPHLIPLPFLGDVSSYTHVSVTDVVVTRWNRTEKSQMSLWAVFLCTVI